MTQSAIFDPRAQPARPAPQATQVPMPIETLPSIALLKGHPVVRIEHNGALYQLRSTKLGKLILTK